MTAFYCHVTFKFVNIVEISLCFRTAIHDAEGDDDGLTLEQRSCSTYIVCKRDTSIDAQSRETLVCLI